MEKLLNRGLNFAILPLKLDITQVLVDYKKFERSAIWHEFWFGREREEGYKEPIFKTSKNNLPRNYTIPSGLKTYLGAVKSEIMDPRNRNHIKCNLPVSEIEALKDLIRLQKERIITIKPCDKGAGIIILDFQEYLRACNSHLTSVQSYPDGSSKQYYIKVNESMIEVAKLKITHIIEEGFNNKILTKEEYQEMDPTDKNPAKFYCTFKVHKEHQVMEAPPPRPIVSCSGSITENIAFYVEYHIKSLANKHPAFLQDTPDFLRMIEKINQGPPLDPNTLLVTLDIQGLYTNIPQNEGIECLQEELDLRKDQNVPSGFLIRLMEIILKYNLFEFNGEMYQQQIGTAMGSRPAPSYANIFLARKIDNQIINIAKKHGRSSLKLLKRFLDDIFSIFVGSTKILHDFFDEINNINPAIKFTMSHTALKNETLENSCPCVAKYSIPFLDTLCTIENGKIVIDLYRKETDRNQYLLTSSCHPIQCTKNVPFSLALRIVRICSKPETRDMRLNELKIMLLSRDYNVNMIDSAIYKAKIIPREMALRKVNKTQSVRRPALVVTFDPRLPSIPSIQAKHWRSMIHQDPYLAEVFPQPPLTAFKRQRNIKDHTVRAKVPKSIERYPKREVKGMQKCLKNCSACPYIKEGKSVRTSGGTWNLIRKFNCESYNLIYLIECNKNNCQEKYLGTTKNYLRTRLSQHRGYIVNKMLNQPTGEHFNLPGHSVANLTITVIEQIKNNDENYRLEREHYFIRKFNTLNHGMNKQR